MPEKMLGRDLLAVRDMIGDVGRKVLGDRLVEIEFALSNRLGCGYPNERLGDARDSERIVRLHGNSRVTISDPNCRSEVGSGCIDY